MDPEADGVATEAAVGKRRCSHGRPGESASRGGQPPVVAARRGVIWLHGDAYALLITRAEPTTGVREVLAGTRRTLLAARLREGRMPLEPAVLIGEVDGYIGQVAGAAADGPSPSSCSSRAWASQRA